jgi:uncharacterized RmlC-like cupin family protein
MHAPRLVPILRRTDPRGVLGVAQHPEHVPFPIARMFYTAGVPRGARRGGHAHRTLEEFLVVPVGRVHVRAEWAGGVVEAELDATSAGFHLPPMAWLELSDYAEGTVVVVLASAVFEEADYIRDRAEFDRLLAHG